MSAAIETRAVEVPASEFLWFGRACLDLSRSAAGFAVDLLNNPDAESGDEVDFAKIERQLEVARDWAAQAEIFLDLASDQGPEVNY